MQEVVDRIRFSNGCHRSGTNAGVTLEYLVSRFPVVTPDQSLRLLDLGHLAPSTNGLTADTLDELIEQTGITID